MKSVFAFAMEKVQRLGKAGLRHCEWFASGLARATVSDGKLTVGGAAALTLLLWIPLMLFPFYSPSGGVLRGDWTDHYHHNYAAWSFLKHGFAIYRLPLGQWHAGYPYQWLVHWQEHPFEYPPGCLLLFMPTAIVGRYASFGYSQLGTFLVIYLLAISQLAFFAMLMLFRNSAKGARTVVAVYCWVLMTHIALTGFYEATWLGLAVMQLLSLKQRRYNASVYWFSAAALISFRAAALIPFLLVALWHIYKERPAGYWWSVGVMSLVGVVDLVAFYAITQATQAVVNTRDYFNITFVQMQLDNPRIALAIIGGAVGVLVAVMARNWLAALALVFAACLLHLNGGHFWRMSMLIVFPLAAVAFTSHRMASVLRSTSVAVCLVMGASFSMVTNGDPTTIVSDVLKSFPPVSLFYRVVLASVSVSVGLLLVLHGVQLRRKPSELETSPTVLGSSEAAQ